MYTYAKTYTTICVNTALGIIGMYYFFIMTSYFVAASPVQNDTTRWLVLLDANNTIISIEHAQAVKHQLPDAFVNAAAKIYGKQPEVLYVLAKERRARGHEGTYGAFLKEATTLAPFRAEYRNAWIEYLIQTHDTDALIRDIDTRRYEGLHEELTPSLYKVGLDMYHSGKMKEAELLWWAAARISPSWSHVWIEWASLFVVMGNRENARMVLDECSNDAYAKDHCQEAASLFISGTLPPPGEYAWIIVNEGE